MDKRMTISVIVPTLQAGSHLPALFAVLKNQTMPPDEIVVIDSSSTDVSADFARREGATVLTIPWLDFRHGRARNLAARAASSDYLVFLTQDALPTGNTFLELLTLPLRSTLAAAACARQIAYPTASPLEKFARSYNYPETSFMRSLEDVERLGIKAFFFSNTASTVTRREFWEAGGFREDLIVNEDMYLCSVLLHAGKKVAYTAEAVVFHSHNYPLDSLFKRYFDIGVFFAQAGDTLSQGRTGGEGFNFIIQAGRTLVRQRQYGWLFRLALESVVKWCAFQTGKRYRLLPKAIKQRMSGHLAFWSSLQEK
jgi:rhamnosyltransferase